MCKTDDNTCWLILQDFCNNILRFEVFYSQFTLTQSIYSHVFFPYFRTDIQWNHNVFRMCAKKQLNETWLRSSKHQVHCVVTGLFPLHCSKWIWHLRVYTTLVCNKKWLERYLGRNSSFTKFMAQLLGNV